jgi:hypothetical protein
MAKNAVDPSSGAQPTQQPTPFTDSGAVRFGMPHALVISVCVIVAAVLAGVGLDVKAALLLVTGGAGAGGAVVLLVTTGGRGGGRWGRLIRVYMSAGN